MCGSGTHPWAVVGTVLILGTTKIEYTTTTRTTIEVTESTLLSYSHFTFESSTMARTEDRRTSTAKIVCLRCADCGAVCEASQAAIDKLSRDFPDSVHVPWQPGPGTDVATRSAPTPCPRGRHNFREEQGSTFRVHSESATAGEVSGAFSVFRCTVCGWYTTPAFEATRRVPQIGNAVRSLLEDNGGRMLYLTQ